MNREIAVEHGVIEVTVVIGALLRVGRGMPALLTLSL